MGTATTLFVGLPELLRCVAEVTRSRKQLANLRLVNRAFHAEATFVLFRDFDLHVELSSRVSLQENSAHLSHARRLSVTPGWCFDTEAQNERIQNMVAKMPRLESFEYVILSSISTAAKLTKALWFRCRDIPLTTDTLKVLKVSCPRIKAIHIAFPSGMETTARWDRLKAPGVPVYPGYRQIPEIYKRPDVAMFSRLEELTLEWLFHDLVWWKSQVVRLLTNSPGLRKLHLSISPWQPDIFRDFLDSVCDEYGQAGALPLRLRSLKCGISVYPRNITLLNKLTNLAYLEEVYVANQIGRLGAYNAYAAFTEPSRVAYHAFGPAHSPNLRRFSTAAYRPEVQAFLCAINDTSFARQLAISCGEQTSQNLELAALLRPSHRHVAAHFRMLDIELQREVMTLREDDNDNGDCDDDDDDDDDDEYPIESVLQDLVTDDGGALEGLMVRVPENPEHECGFDDLELLEGAVAKLVNLTQLAVAVGDFADVRGLDVTEEMLVRAAERLAVAAPRLRYVKLCSQHYRIWRNEDDTIRLDELDDDEISDVELFNHSNYLPKLSY